MVGVWSWFSFWLILHILAVIVAFGPTFAFPFMGAYAQRHMEAGPTVAHLTEQIERRMTIPIAIIVPLLGTALIFSGHFNLWKSKWLLISIVLYIIAFFFAVLVQAPNGNRLVQAIAKMPAGPPPAGATGPPPEIAALTKKLQAGGMFLLLMIVSIVVLMVWRPGCVRFGVHGC
jgi:uncharacterized membrane protein